MINKKISSTFGVAVILIVSVFIGGLFWFSNNNQEKVADNSVANKSEKVSSDNWQTYENEDYGFEFKYPSFWGVPELNINQPYNDAVWVDIITETPSEEDLSFTISKDINIKLSSEKSIQNNIDSFKKSEIYKTVVNLTEGEDNIIEIPVKNGVAFYYVSQNGMLGPSPSATIVGSDEIWHMSLWRRFDDLEKLKEREDILRKILSTFEFLDEVDKIGSKNDNLNDWSLYKNDKFGIEFNYPQSIELNGSENDIGWYTVSGNHNRANDIFFNFSVLDKTEGLKNIKSLEYREKNLFVPNELNFKNGKFIQVDGYGSGNYYFIDDYYEGEDYVYHFMMSNPEYVEEAAELFEKILISAKLTK